MNKAKSDFLSWPKHLTRDYFGTLMMGFGLGCMVDRTALAGVSDIVVMAIALSVMLVGAFVRRDGPHLTRKLGSVLK